VAKTSLRRAVLALVAAVVVTGWPASASTEGWRTIIPGVTYQEFVLPGPVRVYVARMDIAASDVILESSIATGALAEGRETVSEMAARYDGTLTAWGGAWGPRRRVVVAVNGSSYFPESGEPYGGLVHDGWYALRFGEVAGTSGLAWTSEREAAIGGCVSNPEAGNIVVHSRTGSPFSIRSVNRSVTGLTLFTPQYGPATPERGNVREAVLEVDRPLGLAPLTRPVRGVVREVKRGGNTPLLFDEIVLAARGGEARNWIEAVEAGDVLTIAQEIVDLGHNCRSDPFVNWANVHASIGGGFEFLHAGRLRESDDAGAYERDPRTAFCLNDDHVDFVVVDGREDAWSIGMSLEEVGEFCRDTLDDDYGINQDGGGSSTMWVDGAIVNRPSDGGQRAVANGMMMVRVDPPRHSSRFSPGYRVLVQQSGELRLGPGSNYPVRRAVVPGTLVELLPTHNGANGAFATGMFWWKALYDGEEGWIQEASLVSRLRSLAVFEIPMWWGEP
jgi:hypothetical protein